MNKKVIRIGTSAGITISREALDVLGVGIGDIVEMSTTQGVLTVKPVHPKSDSPIDPQVLQWGQEFIDKNKELLKRLKDK